MERGGPNHQNEHPQDDRELVLAFQQGCPLAYEAIYRRHEARVRATCSRILARREDAQEAVQETFLRAYQALGRFNGRYELGAWLSRIATNVCVDQLRAQSRRMPLALVPSIDSNIRDPSAEPEEIVTRRDPRVHRAIRGIQPLHARALELRAVHGMSHDEMASRLSMSPSQVKALLHRARRSFRRAFEKTGSWAAAPLVGLRSVAHRSRDASSGHDSLLLAGGPAGHALAEKAVASVVFAALAFSGFGGDDAPNIGGRTPPVESYVAPDVVGAAGNDVATGSVRTAIYGSADAGSSASEAPASRDAKDEGFVAQVIRSVDGTSPARPPTPPEEPPEEPSGPTPWVPTTTELDVIEKVKELIESVPPEDPA